MEIKINNLEKLDVRGLQKNYEYFPRHYYAPAPGIAVGSLTTLSEKNF